ncbi:MAG: helix-turn-helix transcriptional regulator [Lachnospiraceae bacterium]|nr:helix-turn-helix transcriptional regulator [Lachnospiraceae bacterium]
MIKMQIGQIIYDIRTEMKISQEELSYGLCTVSALSKYENGTRFPDSLLFHAFMERLGKSPTRVMIMISEQDFAYYEWKKKTQDAIKRQRWEEVKNLRDWGHAKNPEINEVMQKQYELYLDSIIWDKLNHNMQRSYECIREAIQLTIPDIYAWDESKGLISGYEMNMVFLYLRAQKRLGMENSSEIKRLFDTFVRYVDRRVSDIFEISKIYPRLVCAMVHLNGQSMDVKERILLEKKALQQLKRTMEIYDMPELLRLLAEDLRSIGEVEAVIYEKQGEALGSVLGKYSVPYVFLLESWCDCNDQICLMNEYLRAGRLQKQMTQEELSEGICAVETYSRIESGRRTPSKKNYRELTERLELNWGYYRGQIVTSHYKDFELMSEQRFDMLEGKLERSEEYLYYLKKRLNMEIVENKQYIELQEIIISDLKGEMKGDTFVERCREILGYTLADVKSVQRFLTKTELELIYQIGWFYESIKEHELTKNILEVILEKYEKRSNSSWYEVGLMKRMLAGAYSELREFEKSNELVYKLIREMTEWQSGQTLAESVYLLAWNYENQKKACDDLYIKAFYLSDLFENQMHRPIFKQYYEDNFNAEMKWY